MHKFRVGVAIIVATALLSVGGAACTPQQTQGAFRAVGNLITLILFAFAMGQSHPAVGS